MLLPPPPHKIALRDTAFSSSGQRNYLPLSTYRAVYESSAFNKNPFCLAQLLFQPSTIPEGSSAALRRSRIAPLGRCCQS